MRPETVALHLKTLPLSLITFTGIIFGLNLAIGLIAIALPRYDHDFPNRKVYICSPQENDGKSDILFFINFFLSILLVAALFPLITKPSNTKAHWPFSTVSILCFICLLKEILQVATGEDNQFYIILSVKDGSCKLAEKFQTDFIVLVVIFIVRCIRGCFTICMCCLAFVFCSFNVQCGSDSTVHPNVTGTVELELAEIPVDTPNTGGPV